ncbi:conserved hypothetical protein [Histoplasma capsulatum H143]|uniref:F-box domain-containing protein n=1 Tax=Ajellomyces capsulatus (strain H143) TaxID=544712 RepID=C6HIW1_AJECH|nr:conserved hypothetical protein [Histoplasma capsulatum H143]
MLRDMITSKPCEIAVYTFTSRSPGVLGNPDINFPVSDRPESSAISYDRMIAAYSTPTTLRCINRRGEVLWSYQFTDRTKGYMCYITQPEFSFDGRVVWLYRPDCGIWGEDCTDKLLAINAATGSIISQVDLGSTGHCARFLAHPNNQFMLLDVGEGQDGSPLFMFYLDEADSVQLTRCDWCVGYRLLDISLDGTRCVSVDEMQNRVILHSLPSGQTLGTIEVDEFGQDASYIETYPGGYCDDNSVIINVRGESEGSDWNQRFLLDAHAMKVIRPIGPQTEDAESLFLPGNGMFVNSWSIEEIPTE